MILLSDFIAYRWLNPERLSQPLLVEALVFISVVVGLRLPLALYMGGLNGLQRQYLANLLLATFETVQNAGALAVLWLIEPTVKAFFLWQALATVFQVLAFKIALSRSIASDRKGVYCRDIVNQVWRFAAGMSGTSALGLVITQMDKVLLSKLLTLTEFGYYTLAVAVASVINRLIKPVATAYYPRFTELISLDDRPGLARAYHQGCQLMAVSVLPLALVMAFFSEDLLRLWISDPVVVSHVYLLVSLLVVGNALNSLLTLPYMMQLAYGWTTLGFYLHVIDMFLLVPAFYFSIVNWGTVGAAATWVAFNCGHFIAVRVMYSRLLINEMQRWYVNDVGILIAVVLLVTGLGRVAMPDDFSEMQKIMLMVVVFSISILSVAFSAELIRERILSAFNKKNSF
jgi:O-antigen/teichoic acid export membrane protein